ncbi:MAG: hypothetical protein WDN66_00385 [Candidatus Saccharibacteria bacterium]
MTIDLVFLLLILHFYKKIRIGKGEWIAIAMVCLGLSGALIFSNPTTGQKGYDVSNLLVVIYVISAIILVVFF